MPVFDGKPFKGANFRSVIEKLDITRLTDTQNKYFESISNAVFVTEYFVVLLLMIY